MSAYGGSELVLSFLFACFAKATLLLCCAWIATVAMRRHSSAVRHHSWAVAIVASLALPILMMLLPAWRSSALGDAAALLKPAGAGAVASVSQTIASTTINAVTVSPVYKKIARAILIIWAFGFLLVLLRLMTGLARLVWMSTLARPLFEDDWMRDVLTFSNIFEIARPARLLQCRSLLAMPLTWGFLRPVIVLPAGSSTWTAERRRIVLAHELAHIGRHDWLVQICGELARAVYWFHPLVWLAAARLRHESECACDDAVLMSGISPSRYASELLDLARTLENSGRAWTTSLAIARPSNLERRFAAMLNSSVNRKSLSNKAKYLILCFALGCLLPLATLRVSAQNLAGKTSGTIHDPSGSPVANATIVMSNHGANTIDMTTTDRDGNFSFKSLPAGKYELQVYKPGFAPLHRADVTLDPGAEFAEVFTLSVGADFETVRVVPSGSEKPAVTDESDGKPSRLGIGGTVEAAKLIKRVQPIYPESAKSDGAQGTVVLHAVIGMDGKPLSLRVMNSEIDPRLSRSAVEAVSQWRYSPTLLNGEPIEVDTTITVNYTLEP
ncbi:MAG TPA: M56 family metallopeptidase [Candidatus Solibacter sp.]|nr:M56 family metallopeptidase [Candidatus Solibacter sp.]